MKRRRYWNEEGVGREALITEIVAALETEGWRYSTDTGWKPWDIQIYGNLWWNLRLRTVTEYHGGPKCLTRVRLTYHPVVTTVLLNVIFASILLYRQAVDHRRPCMTSGCWELYAVFLLFLAYRAFWLKLRVADLTDTAAMKCGLTHITGQRAKKRSVPATRKPPSLPPPTTARCKARETVTSVSPQPSP